MEEDYEELRRLLARLPIEERLRIIEPIIEAQRKLDAPMLEPITMAQFEELLFDWNG